MPSVHADAVSQFAEAFENKGGLGARTTVSERVSVLSTKGYIKFFRDPENYQLPPAGRSRFGYLCVEGMTLGTAKEVVDPETGEILEEYIPVYPTHYKCAQSGAVLEVENPRQWVYPDTGTGGES